MRANHSTILAQVDRGSVAACNQSYPCCEQSSDSVARTHRDRSESVTQDARPGSRVCVRAEKPTPSLLTSPKGSCLVGRPFSGIYEACVKLSGEISEARATVSRRKCCIGKRRDNRKGAEVFCSDDIRSEPCHHAHYDPPVQPPPIQVI